MDYAFTQILAVDPATGQVAPQAEGQVFALGDTSFSTPLTVTTSGGVSTTTVLSGPQGIIEEFVVADRAQVWWVGGGFAFVLTSATGLLRDVEGSAQAAAAAAAAASDAAAKAFRLPRGGENPPAWWGAFTAVNAPTAGDGARAGDLGVLLP